MGSMRKQDHDSSLGMIAALIPQDVNPEGCRAGSLLATECSGKVKIHRFILVNLDGRGEQAAAVILQKTNGHLRTALHSRMHPVLHR